jgi:hypothetical protein
MAEGLVVGIGRDGASNGKKRHFHAGKFAQQALF